MLTFHSYYGERKCCEEEQGSSHRGEDNRNVQVCLLFENNVNGDLNQQIIFFDKYLEVY